MAMLTGARRCSDLNDCSPGPSPDLTLYFALCLEARTRAKQRIKEKLGLSLAGNEAYAEWVGHRTSIRALAVFGSLRYTLAVRLFIQGLGVVRRKGCSRVAGVAP